MTQAGGYRSDTPPLAPSPSSRQNHIFDINAQKTGIYAARKPPGKMQSPPQRRRLVSTLWRGAGLLMEQFYYRDSLGQLRGPCTRDVLMALWKLELIQQETQIQEGLAGQPFLFAKILPELPPSIKHAPISEGIFTSYQSTKDRWGLIASIYFLNAQIACLFAAILTPLLSVIEFKAFFLDRFPSDTTAPVWIIAYVVLAVGCILEFCFFGALYFVFAYIKKRGLNPD